jgi:phage-related protein
MRLKVKDGIGRAAYVTAGGHRVVVVHVFVKKLRKRRAARSRPRWERRRRYDEPQVYSGGGSVPRMAQGS